MATPSFIIPPIVPYVKMDNRQAVHCCQMMESPSETSGIFILTQVIQITFPTSCKL